MNYGVKNELWSKSIQEGTYNGAAGTRTGQQREEWGGARNALYNKHHTQIYFNGLVAPMIYQTDGGEAMDMMTTATDQLNYTGARNGDQL